MERSEIEMSAAELKRRLDAGEVPVLIDVRHPEEHAVCRLPGSRLLPLDQLFAAPEELDPEEELVLYCHHGIRSLNAAMFLRSRGFTRAKSLAGGIDGWSLSVDASVPRY